MQKPNPEQVYDHITRNHRRSTVLGMGGLIVLLLMLALLCSSFR